MDNGLECKMLSNNYRVRKFHQAKFLNNALQNHQFHNRKIRRQKEIRAEVQVAGTSLKAKLSAESYRCSLGKLSRYYKAGRYKYI